MTICKFWERGSCRNGDQCRFEHPSATRPPANNNRFAALQSPNNPSPRNINSYQNESGGSAGRTLPYSLDKAGILADLTTEKPQWILSVYGPGRNAPIELFDGPREQSFEEMRLLHYIAVASGNPQQAIQEAEQLYQTALAQMQQAASNVDRAIEFIINGEKQHPNRIDICQQSEAGNPIGGPSNPFAKSVSPFPPGPAANPFAAANQPTAPAFGAPSAPSGAFGQPSALGAKPSPFGAPTSTFGAPSQLGNAGAFGQPSALGQKPNSFGAPLGGVAPFSAFAAKPSPFSQPAVTSAFGAPSQPAVTSPSGAPSQPAQSPPFGQAPSQPTIPFGTANSLPFGAPSPAPKNPFDAQTKSQPTHTPFGGNTAPPSNPFAQAVPKAPSSFGKQQPTSAALNPFGQPQPSAPAPSPFDQTPSSNSNPFSRPLQPPQQIANGTISRSGELGSTHPHVDTYTTRDQSGRLLTFKGKRVVYNDSNPGFTRLDGQWQKIMFPTGPPQQSLDHQMPDEMYDDSIKEEYKYASKTGNFKDNKMPLLPPMNSWCSFDF